MSQPYHKMAAVDDDHATLLGDPMPSFKTFCGPEGLMSRETDIFKGFRSLEKSCS